MGKPATAVGIRKLDDELRAEIERLALERRLDKYLFNQQFYSPEVYEAIRAFKPDGAYTDTIDIGGDE